MGSKGSRQSLASGCKAFLCRKPSACTRAGTWSSDLGMPKGCASVLYLEPVSTFLTCETQNHGGGKQPSTFKPSAKDHGACLGASVSEGATHTANEICSWQRASVGSNSASSTCPPNGQVDLCGFCCRSFSEIRTSLPPPPPPHEDVKKLDGPD